MSQDVRGHTSNLWGLILGNAFREIDARREFTKVACDFSTWWEAYSVLEMTWQWRISANLHFLPTMSTLSISWSRQSISKLQKSNSANLCKKSRIRNSFSYLKSSLQLTFSNFLLFSVFNNPKAEALKCAGTLWYLRGSLVVPTNQSESDIIETTFFPTLIAF